MKDTLRYNQTSGGREESSAEHSWRLSLMVFVVAEKLKLDLNVDRAIKIAIGMHDLANQSQRRHRCCADCKRRNFQREKQQLEIEAMEKLRSMLPDEIGTEVVALWEEYEKSETQEAKYLKALDKLETLTQLIEAGYAFYDQPEYIANYADKAVRNFPELTPILRR